MATNAAQENWIRNAEGRAMNPDGAYGLQCVDVADDYCQAIFGSWQSTIGGGNAIDLFRESASLWCIGYNGSNKPERGDIVIWGATAGNPYGHIAVVTSATHEGMTVLQQNYNNGGAANTPCSHDYMSYSGAGYGTVVGWLRPRVSGATTPNPDELVSGAGGGGGGTSGPPPRERNQRDVKGGSPGGGSGAVLDGMDWDKLCMLEASGNWACDTGNGFCGGLQFLPSTWREYGGGKYAVCAHRATREQQIEIGRKVLKGQGVMAWPNTGPKCYNPGAADSSGGGGGDGTIAKCYAAPNPASNVTGEYHAGERVTMEGYVLGTRVEFDGGGSSFWYITPKGFSPYRYWEPTETSGLTDKTAYASWGKGIEDYEKLKTDYSTEWDGATGWQPWHDSAGGGWDTTAGAGITVAASYNNGAVFCPPGSSGSGVALYNYDIPNHSVKWGEIPEDLWYYLLSIGWYGQRGDGEERIYPPTSTIPTIQSASGDRYSSAPSHSSQSTVNLWLTWSDAVGWANPPNTACLGAWYWLVNVAGWKRGPESDSTIYAPQHPNYPNCVTPIRETKYPAVKIHATDECSPHFADVLRQAGWTPSGVWLLVP